MVFLRHDQSAIVPVHLESFTLMIFCILKNTTHGTDVVKAGFKEQHSVEDSNKLLSNERIERET